MSTSKAEQQGLVSENNSSVHASTKSPDQDEVRAGLLVDWREAGEGQTPADKPNDDRLRDEN